MDNCKYIDACRYTEECVRYDNEQDCVLYKLYTRVIEAGMNLEEFLNEHTIEWGSKDE